jgi:hypothetical protein
MTLWRPPDVICFYKKNAFTRLPCAQNLAQFNAEHMVSTILTDIIDAAVHESETDRWHAVCCVCQNTGYLYCCDGCVRAFHRECAHRWNPREYAMTLDSMSCLYCPICTQYGVQASNCMLQQQKRQRSWLKQHIIGQHWSAVTHALTQMTPSELHARNMADARDTLEEYAVSREEGCVTCTQREESMGSRLRAECELQQSSPELEEEEATTSSSGGNTSDSEKRFQHHLHALALGDFGVHHDSGGGGASSDDSMVCSCGGNDPDCPNCTDPAHERVTGYVGWCTTCNLRVCACERTLE